MTKGATVIYTENITVVIRDKGVRGGTKGYMGSNIWWRKETWLWVVSTQWCIVEVYTWNLYNFINQHHPTKFNKIEKENKGINCARLPGSVMCPLPSYTQALLCTQHLAAVHPQQSSQNAERIFTHTHAHTHTRTHRVNSLARSEQLFLVVCTPHERSPYSEV